MSTFVIGDLHGHYHEFASILLDAGLVDKDLNWTGGNHALWLMGDFFDRGPDGVSCVDLTMRLQEQARSTGGEVNSVIGNHDISLLSAYLLPDKMTDGPYGTFLEDWQRSGNPEDLERLTSRHVEWLTSLPAIALVDEYLLVHADAVLYLEYGSSIDEVNQRFRDIVYGDDPHEWDHFLEVFSGHRYFWESLEQAADFLDRYGGKRIIHGHTPISKMVDIDPEFIWKPLIYNNGMCINMDGGIYMGSPGFYYLLPPIEE
ncbi:MAG: serine/threonine protein phosphatase [Chloroflexi bacterium]|nr:serine/threonine protein phosphatase [Chloroflexota bacterium]